ncbi:MAG TPA: Rne/Rng family ribonuclease [Candidatus Polarisedimenticolaceae bacterium]|nr:Rne/Rng family ribonuclease [Candidatus Polarisedimenticolaceae bacterium]
MSKIMLVNVTHVEESRVAILEDGVLEQYEIETINRTNIKGNIHNAVVENIHPALDAAFLRISGDLKGFLPLDEVNFKLLPARTESRAKGRIGQHLHPGQKLMVQVVREPFAGKPPTVTTYFSLPGRYLVLMPGADSAGISRKIQDEAQRDRLKKMVDELNPPEGFGLIVRTAGVGQTKTELQRDLRYLLRLWDSIQRASRQTEFPGLVYRERDLVIRTMRDYFTQDIDEVWIDSQETYDRALEFVSDVMPAKAKIIKLHTGDRPLFSKFNLEEQIESIYKRRVPLKTGGEIVIDGTEALTAIDVNSKGAPKHGDAEDNATHTNLEAAAEIGRQLRLRDLGGLVVIDFIDMMAARNQKKVETAMRAAMKTDRAKYDVTRISKLGLLEIARQRIKGEKMGASYATCPECEGYGLIKNVEPAGLAALRKLQTRCIRNDFGKVHMRVPPEIAHWILNHKRDDLVSLERRYQVRILVEPKGSLLRHESEFEFFPREKIEVPPALVAGDRPAPPAPPDLVDLEKADEPEAAEAEAKAAPQQEDENGSGKRRRRRGRRGGRGRNRSRGQEGDSENAPPPEAPEVAAAPPAEDLGEAIDDEDGDDALEEPAGDTPEVAAQGEGASQDENGEGGRRRRRRRRGRRGRGGRGAPQGAPSNGSDNAGQEPAPPATAAAPSSGHDDEPSVPRGVVAHELMPAATGGRRRGRRGGRGRRGFGFTEPADPQLISPQNPVPKPRFDED